VAVKRRGENTVPVSLDKVVQQPHVPAGKRTGAVGSEFVLKWGIPNNRNYLMRDNLRERSVFLSG